jgi:hypothetical protein
LRRLVALAGCAVISALAGSGCGSGDAEEVKQAFRDLRRAYLVEDYRAACALMAPAARREVGEIGHEQRTRCPHDLAQNMSAAVLSPRDRVDPPIREIAVDGDRAHVVALLGGTTPGVVHFVKDGERWKLARLFGVTAPPPRDLR